MEFDVIAVAVKPASEGPVDPAAITFIGEEYEDHFNGVQFYGSAVYDGITYGIWVFEDGSFTNKGIFLSGSVE
jgi:hypothetical protein